VGLLLSSCGEEAEGDPKEIVEAATEAMSAIDSVHFLLDMGEFGLEILSGMTASRFDGEAVRPDRVQAAVRVTVSGISLTVDYRAIGDAQYVTNPLDRRAWQTLRGPPVAKSLLDPSDGVTAVLSRLTDLELVSLESAAGVKAHHITALIPNSDVAEFFGSPPADGVTTVELWIGTQDSLVRKLVLTGPSLQGDPPDTQRTIELSKYDEPVSIVAPI
jgi:lipoprotein LprG